MFENLTEKFERAFKVLKGQGQITEINVAETLKEVRRALLDSSTSEASGTVVLAVSVDVVHLKLWTRASAADGATTRAPLNVATLRRIRRKRRLLCRTSVTLGSLRSKTDRDVSH